jgi:hypothetical protein
MYPPVARDAPLFQKEKDMSQVAIQQERSKMNDSKEMIFILVDSVGQDGKWIPAELIYKKAAEAPELSHLLRSQIKNYLYTLKDEQRLVMKYGHGKFDCQTPARARALQLLEAKAPDTPSDELPSPPEPARRESKPRTDRSETRVSFKDFLTEFVGADEISVSALQAEAAHRGFGSASSVNSMLLYFRNKGFLMKNMRGVVKLVDAPSPNSKGIEEKTVDENKISWQKALELIKEFAGGKEFAPKDFVAEGLKRNMGNVEALRQHVPDLHERGFLIKLGRGRYRLKNSKEEPPAEVAVTSELPTSPAPAEPVATPSEAAADPVPVMKIDPYDRAEQLLKQVEGDEEVAKAVQAAHSLAEVLRRIPKEHWNKAIGLARIVANDRK